mgnify:CR=1 FL=1
MTSLKEGDKAPFFKGINQDGKEITSEDFKGKKLVLYFIRRITLPDVRPKLAA